MIIVMLIVVEIFSVYSFILIDRKVCVLAVNVCVWDLKPGSVDVIQEY